MPKIISYQKGQLINNIEVICELPPVKINSGINAGKNIRLFRFKCYCGNIFDNYMGQIKGNFIKSCGCAGHTRDMGGVNNPNIKHGLSNHPLYRVYSGMIQRCYYPKHNRFKNYGGRGITVSDEWRNDFKVFFDDMIYGYKHGLKLERINNDGNYEKSNCKWATNTEQSSNTTRNIFYEYNGEIKTLMQWCTELKINYSAVYYRLKRSNQSVEKAFH